MNPAKWYPLPGECVGWVNLKQRGYPDVKVVCNIRKENAFCATVRSDCIEEWCINQDTGEARPKRTLESSASIGGGQNRIIGFDGTCPAPWVPMKCDWRTRNCGVSYGFGRGAIGSGEKCAGINQYGCKPAGYSGSAWDTLGAAWDVATSVAAFVPGYGTAIAAGMAWVAAVGRGESFEDAIVAAGRSAIPGGPAVQVGYDIAVALVRGGDLDDALLDAARAQLPPVAQAAFDAGVAVASGSAWDTGLFNAARAQLEAELRAELPELPERVTEALTLFDNTVSAARAASPRPPGPSLVGTETPVISAGGVVQLPSEGQLLLSEALGLQAPTIGTLSKLAPKRDTELLDGIVKTLGAIATFLFLAKVLRGGF